MAYPSQARCPMRRGVSQHPSALREASWRKSRGQSVIPAMRTRDDTKWAM